MLTSSVVSEGFPSFSPPRTDSTTAFPSTRMEIIDDDCKLILTNLDHSHNVTLL